ncbi:MAG: hypothetical protein J7K68_06565 [Candidatus Diapherotrites archaeon]|nr:hypothetical protein [Candidatus Diapherotrites archaeon]
MLLSKAIEIASKEDSELLARGFYLTSAITTLDSFDEKPTWSLIYFKPETGKVLSVAVSKDRVGVGEVSEPLVRNHYERLDVSGNLSSDKIIDIMKKKLSEKQIKPVKIVITLRSNKWRTIIVTSNLKFVNIDIDPKTGNITLFEISSVTKRV